MGIAVTFGLVELSTAVLKSPEPHVATRLIAAMVTLRSAQAAFAASCGRGGYAASIAQLDTASLDAPDVIFTGLQLELKAMPGARWDAPDCHGYPTTRAFYATAEGGRGWSGPTFALDTNGVIWKSETATPPEPPFTAPGLSAIR